MRTVALVMAIISILVLLPPGFASDECSSNATSARACVTLPATKPSTPPPAPAVPQQTDPYWGTYYLFVSGTPCENPLSFDCRGEPNGAPAGVPVPTGGDVGLNVFGVLYQESNGVTGLQREPTSNNGLKAPDRIVLI